MAFSVYHTFYPSAVVFKPVLQAPLPCTFCMSPLSDTPDSTHQLVTRDCKTWIDLSVSPAPLVTVAPSDKQTELLTVLQWQLQCENLVPRCFCTILDTEGHQMGIKYSMEGFIKYLKINKVGNSNRGFTDHNANGRSLKLRSVITIADDDMQDQHCSCIAGYH